MNRLPDTPWHVGYAKKEDADPIRHKARCIHNKAGKCCCGESGCFKMNCPGSSHCKFYAETHEQWENIYTNTRTIDQLGMIQAEKYKQSMIEKKREMIAQNNKLEKYAKLSNLYECVVCGERLMQFKYGLKCGYCKAFYVSCDFDNELLTTDMKYDGVFYVGQKEENGKATKKRMTSIACEFIGKRQKCTCIMSEYVNKSCHKEKCVLYKPYGKK